MKTVHLISVIAFLLLQSIAVIVNAAGICQIDKSDIAGDMQKIKAKLATRYQKPIDKVAIKTIYDTQQLKVDRTDAFLSQVNAVGIVTDAPLGTQEGYGTAVLISPCHVLINAHAVTRNAVRDGKSFIYISIGQAACDSKNEFSHQDIQGQVIAIGDYYQDDSKIDPSQDQAVVRIKEIKDIKPAQFAIRGITKFDSLMSVGFPFSSTYSQKTGLRYSTVNFLRQKDIRTDGIFKTTNQTDLPGASGSGLFILDESNGQPSLTLAGIHRGPGEGIQTAAILDNLRLNYPPVYLELINAIERGSCNSDKGDQ